MAYAEGRYPGQSWKREPPQEVATNCTIRLKDISGNNLPFQILTGRPANQEVGRRGSIRIRKDSIAQAVQMIHKDQLTELHL